MRFWQLVQILDLRFPSKDDEAAFKRSQEIRLIYLGVGGSLAWGLGLVFFVMHIYVAEISRHSNAFSWSQIDARTYFFTSHLSLLSLTCFVDILALLHVWTRWLSDWNWEMLFLFSCAITLLVLPFASHRWVATLWNTPDLEVWGDTEGYPTSFQSLVQLVVLLQCLVMPFRSSHSWILVVCAIASTCTAEIASAIPAAPQMLLFLTFAMQVAVCWVTAWCMEKQTRSIWNLHKQLQAASVQVVFSSESSSVCPPRRSTSSLTKLAPHVVSLAERIKNVGEKNSDGSTPSSSRKATDTSLFAVEELPSRMQTGDTLASFSNSQDDISCDSPEFQHSLLGICNVDLERSLDNIPNRFLGCIASAASSQESPPASHQDLPRVSSRKPTEESGRPTDNLPNDRVMSIGRTSFGRKSFSDSRTSFGTRSLPENRFSFKSTSEISLDLSQTTFSSLAHHPPLHNVVRVQSAVQTDSPARVDQGVETWVVWENEGFRCKRCAKPPALPRRMSVDSINDTASNSSHDDTRGRSSSRGRRKSSRRSRSARSSHDSDASSRTSWLESSEQQGRFSPTSMQGRAVALKLFLRRWSLDPEQGSCCAWHTALQSAINIANIMSKGDCDSKFGPMSGWQCTRCGIVSPKTASRCSPCQVLSLSRRIHVDDAPGGGSESVQE